MANETYQEFITKVDGLGKTSTPERNDNLRLNVDKNPLYGEVISIPIGSYLNANSNNLNKPFYLGTGILDYTYNDKNPLSEEINEKYNNNPNDNYVANTLTLNKTRKWNGKYENYLEYVSDVYGHEPYFFQLLDNILGSYNLQPSWETNVSDSISVGVNKGSLTQLKYLMNSDAIGIVREPDVNLSLSGINKTNINNFSGTDTPLGIITNQKYAEALKMGATFNTLRNTLYTTKELQQYYGMNDYNIDNLNGNFDINPDTGRLSGTFKSWYKYISELKGGWEGDVNINRYTASALNETFFGENDYNSLNKYFEGDESNFRTNNTIVYQNGDISTYAFYNEEKPQTSSSLFIEGDNSITYNQSSEQSLVTKTTNLFKNNKIHSLINRFHTTHNLDETPDLLNSVYNKTYGFSRGRNLLKKNIGLGVIDRYDNPYCRVWTVNHQYNQYNKTIRPFNSDGKPTTVADFDKQLQGYARVDRGDKSSKLGDYTVLNQNGMVNITPTSDGVIDIKKTMFSIENLAWKDITKPNTTNISNDQIGPLGGRIMWFPPYNIKFNENVNTEWTENKFIGRGEALYTYNNTKRTGSLSFDMIVDHPSIVEYWKSGKEATLTNDEDLLRFYAGCDLLRVDNENAGTTSSVVSKVIPEEKPKIKRNETKDKEISFNVYFPNNYSGVDDLMSKPEEGVNVDAMTYLFCGWGTQAGDTLTGFKLVGDKNIGYEMTKNKSITDISDADYKPIYGSPFKYRIDRRYGEQKLRYATNYKATTDLTPLNNTSTDNATNSFGEVYTTLTNIKSPNTQLIDYALSKGVSKDNINALGSIFASNTNQILEVDINGVASIHGYTAQNEILATDRAKSIESWLKSVLPKQSVEIKYNITHSEDKTPLSLSVNDESAKKRRSVNVVIKYREEYTVIVNDVSNETTTPVAYETLVKETKLKGFGRYDNESAFYKAISNDANFVDYITEKIQHFNPAYHSTTPEGYNMRLTFLHQCTRQGNTISLGDGDSYAKTAGNLSFGRPPFCVLRIGDFYNTKIVIENLGIDFEPLKWDLNTEGVGVQPMIAKVTMSFVFIGGSDLGGPIARLQNAASFNYYANTSAYDNRADSVEYTSMKPTYTQFKFETTEDKNK